MHTATSYSQITASFDAALQQLDTSQSPTPSSSGEHSPQILNSPIRWEMRQLQPIKIEVDSDAEPIRNQISPVENSPQKAQTFFLQPLQNAREKVGRDWPLKKVGSLRKIIEDEGIVSESCNLAEQKHSKSKSFDLTYPLVNGDHSISSEMKLMQQNFPRGSQLANVSQGKAKKYRVVSGAKTPIVNGIDHANTPEKCAKCKEKGIECSNFSGKLKGDNSNDSLSSSLKGDSWDENMFSKLKRGSWDDNSSPRLKGGSWDDNLSPRSRGDPPVKFCISNSDDEEDSSASNSVLKTEFILEI